MASEKLKKWIRQKQEKGISDERIKKSLEKTGYDPSIVDEINDPFDSDGSPEHSEEDLFSSAGQESEDSDMGLSEDNREERVKNIADNLSQGSSDSEKSSFEDRDYGKENTSSSDEESDSSFMEKLPSLSLPSTPNLSLDRVSKPDVSLPSVDLPSAPDISRKQITIVFALILVIGGGAAAYSFIPDDFNPRLLLGPELNSATHLQTLEQLDQRFAGCPDIGVSIQDVSTSGGSTTADILVTGEAWVVLEVMEGGEVIGYSTKQVNGETQMKVNKVGNEAELRPLGCETRYSRTDIN